MLFIVVLSGAVLSQTAGSSSIAQPTPTPVTKKANERPAEKPPAGTEPFDKSSVAAMATRCVKLETEAGDIEIELYPENAPESVRNFLNLMILGAYDSTTFGRVVPGFVIQGGNILARDGGVSQALAKRASRTIPDEPNNILHERGVVSMARPEEPNQASTHFFILVTSAPALDGKYAAFGRVTKGMEIVDAINKAPVEGEKPVKPVHVKKGLVLACVPKP